MPFRIRPIETVDQPFVADVIFEAFSDLDKRHNVPAFLTDREDAIKVASRLFGLTKIRGYAADSDGKIVGVGFLHDLGPAGYGISPLAVDPRSQAQGAGQAILERIIEDAGLATIRLLQDAFNNAALGLYSRYGFVVREHATVIRGRPTGSVKDIVIAQENDLAGRSEALHRHVVGFNRPAFPTRPFMAKRDGEVVGFIAPGADYPFAAALEEATLKPLIATLAATLDRDVTVAIPAPQHETIRWMLDQGGRVVRSMNLMVRGPYARPNGARLHSGSY
jgi:ribosomal protein S18 acetylase RimI-like enzyme